ncbi:MAG: tail protein X [Clostridia bacterium]|nr:tail protein X [Clostridia bacterium]
MASIYRTISGDTWDIIAYKALGDGMLMDKMIAANPEHCEIFIFPAGIELQIPAMQETTSTTNPPWYAG